jgi:hypothetical protein
MSLFLLTAGFGSGWSAYRWRHQQELEELHETLKKWEGVTYVEGLDIIINAPETLIHEQPDEPSDQEREAIEKLRSKLSNRPGGGGGGFSGPRDQPSHPK